MGRAAYRTAHERGAAVQLQLPPPHCTVLDKGDNRLRLLPGCLERLVCTANDLGGHRQHGVGGGEKSAVDRLGDEVVALPRNTNVRLDAPAAVRVAWPS